MFLDSRAGNAILMELDEHNEVFYRFASTLGAEEVEIATQDAFEQYIQAMATEIRTPPIIRFTPQESQEPEESQE